MIYEWNPGSGYRNFGDAFTEIIKSQLPDDLGLRYESSTTHKYFLIGSVITNETISESLNQGMTPIFLGCGWRGSYLKPELVQKAMFFGARGLHTQKELARCGAKVDSLGDSAYTMLQNLDIEKLEDSEGKLLVPHISDNFIFGVSEISELGVDKVILPRVRDAVDTYDIINKIANAEFVLAGAMHACIVAHYYGVPFALFAGGHQDCPPKWLDWLSYLGIPDDKMKFCDNYEDGLAWYESIVSYL
jgi:hypothetical protein